MTSIARPLRQRISCQRPGVALALRFERRGKLGAFGASLCGLAEKPIRKTKHIDRAFDGHEPSLETVERAFETVTDHDSRLQSRIKSADECSRWHRRRFRPQQLPQNANHSF